MNYVCSTSDYNVLGQENLYKKKVKVKVSSIEWHSGRIYSRCLLEGGLLNYSNLALGAY